MTEAGRGYYVERPMTTITPEGRAIVREGDLCVGKLRLDSVAGWSETASSVSYTYRIDVAPW